MRPDMHKVIVERPRRGSRGPFKGAPWEKNAELGELPAKEGIRKPHSARGTLREFNEHLAPLKRYLHKQVGRPWNKVYSEISSRLRTTSVVQQHVRQHLWDFVERHATLGAKGAVYGAPRAYLGRLLKLRPGSLFIHPNSGLLAKVKPARKARAKKS
jgi:hypothetical protein